MIEALDKVLELLEELSADLGVSELSSEPIIHSK